MTKAKARPQRAYHKYTGYTAFEWNALVQGFHFEQRPVLQQALQASLIIARTGRWGVPTLGISQYKIKKFLKAWIEPFKFDPLIRFHQAELVNDLPSTALADITTTKLRYRPARKTETTAPGYKYCSGHKGVCIKYQVTTTMQGTIIDVRGPFPGRRHDKALWTPPFEAYPKHEHSAVELIRLGR